MRKPSDDMVIVAVACVLWHAVLFRPVWASTESGSPSVGAFMAPPPRTTLVYQSFRDGTLVNGQETKIEGVSREASRIRLRVVVQEPEGPEGPFERTDESVVRVSGRSLEGTDREGRTVALLKEPLTVGASWARVLWSWRPTSPLHPSGGAWTKLNPKDGKWVALSVTYRIEGVSRSTMFGEERVVLVVSGISTSAEGSTTTTTEEWASGLGMVRAVASVKDSGGRDLGVTEQRLVRVLKSGN